MKELNQIIFGKGPLASIKGHLCLTKGHLNNPEGPVEIEFPLTGMFYTRLIHPIPRCFISLKWALMLSTDSKITD